MVKVSLFFFFFLVLETFLLKKKIHGLRNIHDLSISAYMT